MDGELPVEEVLVVALGPKSGRTQLADEQYGAGRNGMIDAAGNARTLAGKSAVGIIYYSGHRWGQLASQTSPSRRTSFR